MTGRFDGRDLHPALDVFTRDDMFLGAIVKIVLADEAMGGTAEDEAPELPATPQSSHISGELLGPMPTAPLGNPGPAAQSAAGGYRAGPDEARTLTGGSMVVGKWWGLIGRRTIRLDQILSLSLERVILKQTYAEIDPGGSPRARARSGGSGH